MGGRVGGERRDGDKKRGGREREEIIETDKIQDTVKERDLETYLT